MSSTQPNLEQLAARASRGDLAALASLRSALEPHMTRIVGRALRTTSGTTPLDRQIRKAAGASPRGLNVEEAARQVWDNLAGNLQAMAQRHRGAHDTHCGCQMSEEAAG